MTNLLNVLILVIVKVVLIDGTILNAERNFYKNKLERNNKVNKKIWTRSRTSIDSFDKPNHDGQFLFRGSSIDDDAFQKDYIDDQAAPKVSSYIQRQKRSSKKKLKSKTLHKNSGKKLPKENLNADIKSLKANNSSLFGIMSIIKPTSVFNEYPYEVASYMKNNETSGKSTYSVQNETDISNVDDKINDPLLNIEILTAIKLIPDEDTPNNATEINQDPLDLTDMDLEASIYNTSGTNIKRSMETNQTDNDIIKKKAFDAVSNKTDDAANSSKVSRDIFDKVFPVWKQDAPVPEPKNDNKYFHESHLMVMPKANNEGKTVTEGGLVKVLSMLTKTFKKIMMQHDSINAAHTEVMDIKDKFKSEYEDIKIKFEDFNQKYNMLLETNDKVKELESSLKTKDEAFARKQKVFTENLSEFESQQKKFLAQQRQFYNIQKLMLSQNEKINIKQNSIMKTQNDISLRQNLFSQTLKKFKLAQTENKHPRPITNFMARITSPDPNSETVTDAVMTPSPFTSTTQTMKINLLSIPQIKKFENYDKHLLNEKNVHSIDDIVYKYYFNNTYIDNLIKSRLMNGFSIVEGLSGKRNSKVKRLDNKVDKTILLPVNMNTKGETSTKILNRERRWINHHSRRKSKEQLYKKIAQPLAAPVVDIKPDINKIRSYDYDIGQYFEGAYERPPKPTNAVTKPVIPEKVQYDPYTNMAQKFCNEIGQNVNEQTFKFCVEKSLRRLKSMDTNVAPTAAPSSNKKYYSNQPKAFRNSNKKSYTVNPSPDIATPRQHFTVHQSSNEPQSTSVFMFFPDNEELESNLKDFDLKPDQTGNVYFDGSLHASDMPAIDTNSDGLSDFMPGLDSNSRMDVDPVALDLQEKRRLHVQRMNQHLMKQISRGRFRA